MSDQKSSIEQGAAQADKEKLKDLQNSMKEMASATVPAPEKAPEQSR